MYENECDRAPIVYAFVVEAEDGRRYEVLVHENGLAYEIPIADALDEGTGSVELRRAS